MQPPHSSRSSAESVNPATRPLIWLIGFFAFLNVYSLQSVLPMVMHDFRASPVQAGLAVGATVLAIGLISPFIGMVSDAFGRKNIVCGSLLFLTLPTALIPLVENFEQLVALRFLQGLAVPGIVVVIIAYIAEEFRYGGVARMTTVYVGGTVMGGFCGRFITGHAGDLLGWRGAFFALALLNFMGAMAVIFCLPASRHFKPQRNFAASFRTLATHLKNARLMAACAVGFCVLFSLVGAFTYVNLYLAAPPFSLSSAGLANVFLVYLVGVLITPLAAHWIERQGYKRCLQSAMAVSALGLLCTLHSDLWWVVPGLAVCSTGVFLCQSATISTIAKTVSVGRSLATGIYYFSYYAGGAAGSWLTGLAFERYGWGGTVAVIVVFDMLGVAIVAWVWRRPIAIPRQA
jgi:YNFM family putative membrane transporter